MLLGCDLYWLLIRGAQNTLLRSYSTALLILCMVKSFLNIILKITQDYNFSKIKQYRLLG